MLIEAADHLPAWLNPETAEKRVRTTVGLVVVTIILIITSVKLTVICALDCLRLEIISILLPLLSLTGTIDCYLCISLPTSINQPFCYCHCH